MTCGIDQRIHLGDDARRAPGARVSAPRGRSSRPLAACKPNGDCSSLVRRGVCVRLVSCRNISCTSWPIVRVAGEQAVVGVTARGPRVIVAGAEMAIAAQSVGFAAHHHRHLGVGLEADHAVHDVGAGFLQAVGQLDVGFFVESRAQLDDDRHVLAGLRGGDQRVDDRRFVAGAVQRLLDGEHARVGGGATQEIEHRPEAVERVMQQDVLLADDRQQVGGAGDATRQPRCEDRVLQIRSLHQIVDGIEPVEVDRPGHLVEIHFVQRELPHQEGVEIRRTVARHFEPHGGSVASMRKLAFERAAQVIDFFVVDEQIAVAGHAELIDSRALPCPEKSLDTNCCTMPVSSTKRLRPPRLGQRDHARQRTRCLHDGEAGVATEGVLAGEAHDEVQALVLDARKRPRRVEAERRQHRLDLDARNIARATGRSPSPRWCAPVVRCPAGAGPAAPLR